MNAPPYLSDIFNHLTRGRHLSPEDEPYFSALSADFLAYADYFSPLGFQLIRHDREFFYFAPSDPEKVPDTLPRIAVFAYILVDHAANQGQPIEDYILGRNFLVSTLPHFSLERYAALLRQVEVLDATDLKRVLDHLERLGWLKWLGPDEFRFLRPFHRVFDKCLELSRELKPAPASAENAGPPA
jgi:Condensin complex protein MksE